MHGGYHETRNGARWLGSGHIPEHFGTPAQSDSVSHPSHYTSSPAKCPDCGRTIECIDVVEHLEFSLGNAVKYIWRAGLKTDDVVTDLRKARWYIDREIVRLEKLDPKDLP